MRHDFHHSRLATLYRTMNLDTGKQAMFVRQIDEEEGWIEQYVVQASDYRKFVPALDGRIKQVRRYGRFQLMPLAADESYLLPPDLREYATEQ